MQFKQSVKGAEFWVCSFQVCHLNCLIRVHNLNRTFKEHKFFHALRLCNLSVLVRIALVRCYWFYLVLKNDKIQKYIEEFLLKFHWGKGVTHLCWVKLEEMTNEPDTLQNKVLHDEVHRTMVKQKKKIKPMKVKNKTIYRPSAS